MNKVIVLCTLACGALGGASGAFAQQNQNPMGLDYGAFHPAVPPQVTTYYPPSERTTGPRRHHRLRQPMY